PPQNSAVEEQHYGTADQVRDLHLEYRPGYQVGEIAEHQTAGPYDQRSRRREQPHAESAGNRDERRDLQIACGAAGSYHPPEDHERDGVGHQMAETRVQERAEDDPREHDEMQGTD